MQSSRKHPAPVRRGVVEVALELERGLLHFG